MAKRDMKKRRDKRGLSPVIATVLLVAMVVVIGLIIFLWFRGFQQEAVTKFGGKNIQLVCGDVSFDASFSDSTNTLVVSNLANVPIYQMQAKIESSGRHDTKDLDESYSGWPTSGLNQGGIASINVGTDFDSAEEVVLIPVLRGTSRSGEKTYVCDESAGRTILV